MDDGLYLVLSATLNNGNPNLGHKSGRIRAATPIQQQDHATTNDKREYSAEALPDDYATHKSDTNKLS